MDLPFFTMMKNVSLTGDNNLEDHQQGCIDFHLKIPAIHQITEQCHIIATSPVSEKPHSQCCLL